MPPLHSTFDYRGKILAAIAVTCLTSTSPSLAETAVYARLGGNQLRNLPGRSADSSSIASEGQYVVYLEGTEGDPPVFRETTEQEHLIGTLRRYENLDANWDGEGALSPIHESFRAAGAFACLLSPTVEMPVAMIHATGHAGLVWSSDELDGELEFLDGDRIAYYFSDGKTNRSGVVKPDAKAIPKEIEVFLIAA